MIREVTNEDVEQKYVLGINYPIGYSNQVFCYRIVIRFEQAQFAKIRYHIHFRFAHHGYRDQFIKSHHSRQDVVNVGILNFTLLGVRVWDFLCRVPVQNSADLVLSPPWGVFDSAGHVKNTRMGTVHLLNEHD